MYSSWTSDVFFFSSRRRHTRFDCDWSSDVCSSDLGGMRREFLGCIQPEVAARQRDKRQLAAGKLLAKRSGTAAVIAQDGRPNLNTGGVGRAAGRGKREDLVGGGSFKKKKRKRLESA